MPMKTEMIKKGKMLATAFAVLVVIGVAVAQLRPTVERHLAIDRCLDAGGAFDHQDGLCRFEARPKTRSVVAAKGQRQ